MVDSLYYSSRKIPEKCENSFVDYRMNYQKLCYLIRQITNDLIFRDLPQPRHLSIKLCRGNLFRIKNLIKSNRQNKLKLGVERLVSGCGGVFMGEL